MAEVAVLLLPLKRRRKREREIKEIQGPERRLRKAGGSLEPLEKRGCDDELIGNRGREKKETRETWKILQRPTSLQSPLKKVIK